MLCMVPSPSPREYLDAHPMVIGCIVLLLPSNQVEDAAFLQVSQQLQVSGFLQTAVKPSVGSHF